MKKIILIPDSFKGTMSAQEFCMLGEAVIRRHMPACRVISIPVADGGEGTVDCFAAALDAAVVYVESTGPWGEPVIARYARKDRTAFVETAQNAGLPMVGERLDPGRTTTYGVGEVIRAAVDAGCTRIVLGLGGSCTNDGGVGAAAALGVRFYDRAGKAFIPNGYTLKDIASYDTTEADRRLAGCSLVAMCDIDNPMYGAQGAAQIFGPQKGADEAQIRELDDNLKHLGQVIKARTGRDVAQMPGSGAAGAFGAGVSAFLGGSLQSGIETVLDSVHFDALLKDADLVFTGEGRIDSQSLRGKVVIGVAKHAKAHGVPVVAIVGAVGDGAEGAYDAGVSAVFSVNQRPEDFSVSQYRTKENFSAVMDNVIRLAAASEENCSRL